MTAPTQRRLDRRGGPWPGLLATWCVLWVLIGGWTAYEVWQLASLSSTVADSGRTLDQAGRALQSLGSVPVVGDQTGQLGDRVRANAANVVASAGHARTATHRLSILLGLSIAFIPSVPVAVAGRHLLAADRD